MFLNFQLNILWNNVVKELLKLGNNVLQMQGVTLASFTSWLLSVEGRFQQNKNSGDETS